MFQVKRQTKSTGKNTWRIVQVLKYKMLLRINKEKLDIQEDNWADGIHWQFAEVRQMANKNKYSAQSH